MKTDRPLVCILSPLRAANGRSMERHIKFAELLVQLATVKGGVAGFASHTYYTRFLDDNVPEQREAGMESGVSFLLRADEIWVWDLWGISGGMRQEIDLIDDENRRRWRANQTQIQIRMASRVTEIPAWEELRNVQ